MTVAFEATHGIVTKIMPLDVIRIRALIAWSNKFRRTSLSVDTHVLELGLSFKRWDRLCVNDLGFLLHSLQSYSIYFLNCSSVRANYCLCSEVALLLREWNDVNSGESVFCSCFCCVALHQEMMTNFRVNY